MKKSLPDQQHVAFLGAFNGFVANEKSQWEAAKRLGITQAHVSDLLRGKCGVGLPVLLALRRETGRSIDSLLGLEDIKP